MTTTTQDLTVLNDDFEMHPVHGELTCTDIEESSRRAWTKVNDLTTRVTALDSMLAATRKELADAVVERDAQREAAAALTVEFLNADDLLGQIDDLEGKIAALEDQNAQLRAYLPDVPGTADAAWREATGRATGPVPAHWREHLKSPESAARIQSALDVAMRDALAAALKQAMVEECADYTASA